MTIFQDSKKVVHCTPVDANNTVHYIKNTNEANYVVTY